MSCCYSSGTFVSASEESSGALEFVEKKIAKATMIPRTHGEVICFFLIMIDCKILQAAWFQAEFNNIHILIKSDKRLDVFFSWQAFNILRYELGQKYDSHYDVFNPTEYGPQKSQRVTSILFISQSYFYRILLNLRSLFAFYMQIASFLLYLSDVEEGGETMFPFEVSLQYIIAYIYTQHNFFFFKFWLLNSNGFDCQNGANMGAGYDYKQCIGLKVKPRKGDGLLFYSVFPNGTIDQVNKVSYSSSVVHASSLPTWL